MCKRHQINKALMFSFLSWNAVKQLTVVRIPALSTDGFYLDAGELQLRAIATSEGSSDANEIFDCLNERQI